MKQYRLLKEWPDSEIGDIFQWNGQGYSNQNRTALVVSKKYVEEFDYFFEEVNTVENYRPIEIAVHSTGLWNNKVTSVQVNFSRHLNPEVVPFKEIEKAVYKILNPEPSSKKEEGWEILEGKSSNGKVHQYLKDNSHGGLSCKEIGCEIFSVLRKSDNTVFTVGGQIYHRESEDVDWVNSRSTILKFSISSELMFVEFMENDETNPTGSMCRELCDIAKAPTNTVEDKPFVWTDKGVMEFSGKFLHERVNWAVLHDCTAAPLPITLFLEKFKKSKQTNQ